MKVILSGNTLLWYQKWQNAILLGLLTIGTYGVPIYTFSVILNSMRDIEGWSVSTLAGIYASSLLVAGGIAPFAGRFLDNRSPRIILASGLIVGTFFILIASISSSQIYFFAFWVIGAGILGGTTHYNVTMPILAKIYDPTNRTKAYVILTIIGAMSGPCFVPLAGVLTENYGWRATVQLLLPVMILFALPAIYGLRSKLPTPNKGKNPELPQSTKKLLKSPQVLLTMSIVTLAGLVSSSLILHQVAMIQATGLTLGTAAFLGGLRSFSQIPGRLTLSPLVEKFGISKSLYTLYIVSLAGLGTLYFAGPLVLCLLFVFLTGAGFGAILPLHGILTADVYGTEKIGALTGIQHIAVNIASALGPLLIGISVDFNGNYEIAISVLIGIQILLIATFYFQQLTTNHTTSIINE
ncbi:MAG: MFS transporter [Dehalococcoidia bacterium]